MCLLLLFKIYIYCRHVPQIIDPNAERLNAAAKKGGKDPSALLENTDIFGDLKSKPQFVKILSE